MLKMDPSALLHALLVFYMALASIILLNFLQRTEIFQFSVLYALGIFEVLTFQQPDLIFPTLGFMFDFRLFTEPVSLNHGCARVPHCVTARWRNFSHYCRPLRHYDVWLRVPISEKHWQRRRQHTVYRNKSLEFATEQVGKLCYVTTVDGGLKSFPWVAWFEHPCIKSLNGSSNGFGRRHSSV